MRIVHCIASTRKDHGGTSRSVPSLCDALLDIHVDNWLLTAQPAHCQVASFTTRDPSRTIMLSESKTFGRSTVGNRFFDELIHFQKHDDLPPSIVHDHGVWLGSNHAVAKFARAKRVPRVVSPRGMLSAWALGNGMWKKRLAWMIYQRRDLSTATAFHATSDLEANEIRALGFRQPICVTPNGIEMPPTVLQSNRPSARKAKFMALFMSRIHWKKGLIPFLHAWKDANVSTDWEFAIAGPDEKGHREEVEAVVSKLGLNQVVRFLGEIDDDHKWSVYKEASLFVLPSFSENYGIVVAEALASGLPVLTTTGTPWSELSKEQIGWCVEPTKEALQQGIQEAISLPASELKEMGLRAAKWVRAGYSWEQVARKLTNFYHSLIV